jgi:hypothetical protein
MAGPVQVQGADRLAATAQQVADRLRTGLDHEQAGEEVIGYIRHPTGIPAGVASRLTFTAAPMGFTLGAVGEEPFLQRFLAEPFNTRAEAVADQYAEQLEQLLATLKGA